MCVMLFHFIVLYCTVLFCIVEHCHWTQTNLQVIIIIIIIIIMYDCICVTFRRGFNLRIEDINSGF